MYTFKEIRPYRDSEVAVVVESLLVNNELFDAIAGFQFPLLMKFLPFVSRMLVKQTLKKQLKGVDTIAAVQDLIAVYMQQMIAKTTTQLSESGLEELSMDRSYLFVCNHRDIAMDAAFVNYILYHANHGTVEVAIGDNLLKRPFVSDLMRLNKSFIVKRSLQGREKIKGFKLLSQYIHYSIERGNHVWIAQREGRAKDGLDKTDPAMIKMLHMGRRDGERKLSLKDCVDSLHIVPVSISYEYDPCDEMKAEELFATERDGGFEKDEHTDIASIVAGMVGFKGNIHVSFGKEIKAESSDPITIAEQIDRQVINNYRLHTSNYLAYEKTKMNYPEVGPGLEKLDVNLDELEQKRARFTARYNSLVVELRPYFLRMYANPVINKINFNSLD